MCYPKAMKYGRYGWSYFVLRIGLGLTFLLIGVDMFRHPDLWIGYLPASIPFGISRDMALWGAGAFDIVIGLLFITRMFPKITALLAAAHLVGIFLTNRVDAVIVRDIGLFGACLALVFWPYHYRKKRWWHRKSRHSSSDQDE